MTKIKMTAKRKVKLKKLRQLRERENRKNYRVVAKFFRDFGIDVEKDLKKVDLLAKINWKEFKFRLKKTFEKISTVTINNTVELVNDILNLDLKGQQISAVKNVSLKEYHKQVDSMITKVTDTTKYQIQLVIADGQKKGLNTNSIAENIQQKFVEISEGRAKTIARTETSKAISRTEYNSAVEAQMEYKIWMHTGAGATDRPYHRDVLNNQKIKIDEQFDVNGTMAEHPHDAGLPLKELINCNCIVLYE